MKTTKKDRNYEGCDLESMSGAVNYYNWIVEEFGPYIKGTVVEVGAGSGTFSKYILKQKPKKLIAFEPTKQMAPVLKENIGKNKNVEVHGEFLAAKQKVLKGKADNVFYINVLEHVQNDLEELKIVKDVLKPGGHLCIYVPAMQGIYGSFDERVGHYRRYSKQELKEKLEQAGFEVEKIYYSDVVGIVPWYVNFKIFKSHRLSNSSVVIYDRFVVPLIKFQEKIFKPPVGKNIWAVAKKPKK